MKPKKLVVIMNNFSIGGVERLLLDLTRELKGYYDLRIVSVLGGGPLEPEYKSVPTLIYHASPVSLRGRKLPFKLFWLVVAPITIIRLFAFLLRFKPDIVATSLYQADVIGMPSAFFAGVKKRVIIQHDVQKFSFLKKYFKLVFGFFFSNKVVAVSEDVAGFLFSYWGLPDNKVEVINNGIIVDRFKNTASTVFGSKPVVGIVGRLEPVKDHECLFSALKILKNQGLHPKVIVVGDGSLRSSLENSVQKKGLKTVKFTGATTDVPSMLKKIDILIVPSKEEGFGLVVLEGIVAQKIVVASDINAFKEIINHGENGFLFEAGNAEALASILGKLILSKEFRQKHMTNLSKWLSLYSTQYDIKTIASKYRQIF
jgi:glycosyltransferase involved in cell wall biosynthesis